jgi:hypothetical protein
VGSLAPGAGTRHGRGEYAMNATIAGVLWTVTIVAVLIDARRVPEMMAMALGWSVIATFRWWRRRAAKH